MRLVSVSDSRFAAATFSNPLVEAAMNALSIQPFSMT